MKKLVVFVLIMAIIFVVVNSTVFAPRNPWQIDLVLRDSKLSYWQEVEKGARDAAKELNVTLNVFSIEYDNDYEAQISHLVAALNRKPDALLVAPVHATRLNNALSNLAAAKIPVISLDSKLEWESAKSRILSKNAQAMRMLGDQMLIHTGIEGKAVIISSDINSAVKERAQLLTEYLQQNSKITLDEYLDTHIEAGLAYRKTQELLQAGKDVNIVIALDARSTIEAAQAIAEHIEGQISDAAKDRSSKTPAATVPALYGFDCTNENAVYIENDVIKSTIVQNPYVMGYLGVKTCFNILEGDSTPAIIYTPVITLTKANMFSGINQILQFSMD
ncbi:MAG: substrate-binding domain-containing protein [Saccharofermentanales bacterium]|jgi:ribose transport system substrate-binding protein